MHAMPVSPTSKPIGSCGSTPTSTWPARAFASICAPMRSTPTSSPNITSPPSRAGHRSSSIAQRGCFRNDGRIQFFGKIHEQAEKRTERVERLLFAALGRRYRSRRVPRRAHTTQPLLAQPGVLGMGSRDLPRPPDRVSSFGFVIWSSACAGSSTRAAATIARRRSRKRRRWRVRRSTYYRAEWQSFEGIMSRNGQFEGVRYYSEAMKLLGEGTSGLDPGSARRCGAGGGRPLRRPGRSARPGTPIPRRTLRPTPRQVLAMTYISAR